MLPDHFTRYDQTRFLAVENHPDAGDCMRASVATIIQVDPETLTNWASLGDDWNVVMFNDLLALGYEWVTIPWSKIIEEPPHRRRPMDAEGNPVILVGPGPRGLPHAVVGTVDNGKAVLLHDPHPERRGLTGDPTQVWVLVPINNSLVDETVDEKAGRIAARLKEVS